MNQVRGKFVMESLNERSNTSCQSDSEQYLGNGRRSGMSSREYLLGSKESVDTRYVRGSGRNFKSGKRFAVAEYGVCSSEATRSTKRKVDLSV